MNEIAQVLQRRSTTRGYTAEPLTEEELEALLLAGLQAPTATNRQEIHITVVQDGDPSWTRSRRSGTPWPGRPRRRTSTTARPPCSF